MNFLKLNLKYVIIIMVGATIFSCSKAEDGATGPAGLAGQNGIDGVDGVDGLNGGVDGTDGVDGSNGTDGQDGAVGTANVIYSPLITIDQFDWDVFSGGALWVYQIPAPELTQDIFDKGIVLVYRYSAGDGGRYEPLPVDTYEFIIRLNKVEIRRKQESEPYSSISDQEFRYMLIPGAVSTSGKSSIDYKKMTYEEVMDHFGLEY